MYCCTRSLVRLLPAGKLESAAAALAAPAATARHLHTLAAATLAQCGSEMKPFVCELYVRAITAGMNELERLKLNTEKETEARQQEQTLSSWFTQLGNLLSTSSRLRCECTLTAFSVHPSPAMYVCIQQAPEMPCVAVEQDVKEETTSEFGSWATDSRTQSNLVKTSETLNLKQMQHQANVLSTAILSEGEALGLSPELCQDLAVLLSGPRVKTLSWDMDRNLLLENCRTYMERTHGGTRALTTELKYLNLDPRSYQHLPEEDDAENDAFYGIEKGYEHLVEVQEQEEIWQDAYSDPERTDSVSSINSDIVPLKTTVRKKKKKPPVLSSEEDSDPLSLVAEAKRNEKKKERPHSKERSKERKEKKKSKPKDGTEKKESSRESRKEESKEKKEKKPRKKKIKEEVPFVDHKPGSLSSLIGLKVAKVKIPEGKYKRNSETKVSAPCITDSDYDSQGKSSLASLNSEGNDPDVLFDGLYNMEDYKSPEKGDPLADRSTYTSSELSVANGRVAINTATSLGRTDNRYKLQTSRSNINRTKQDLNTSKNAAIREEVKKSITKLIEFRRQKSLLEETQIFKSIGSSPVTSYSDKSVSPKPSPIVRPNSVNSSPLLKSPKAIVRPEFPEPAVISPKAVEVPEIPKAYINKKQIESLKELKQGVDMLLHSKNPVIQYANKQQPTCESSFQQYVQQRQQIYTHNPYFPISQNRSSASVIHSSQEEPAKEVQRNFEDFLRDLQESINAGTGANTKANTPKNAPARKEVKPISRVQPVIPNFPKTEPGTSSQCAKPTTQSAKKVDSQLNTFARLSYMHKNKQSDVKFNKQALDLSNQEQQQILARCIEDQKSAKIKYLQSRGDISILRVGNNAHSLLKDDSQVVIRKVEKPTSFALDHPVLSNMLHGNHTPAAKQQPRNETQVRSVPYQPEKPIAKHTALSEKDQNELLLLLRQQNKLNTSVSYSSSDVNKTVSSQYLKNDGASNSTPVNHNPVTSVNNSVIMPTEFKNSNVQQYEGCRVRTVHCDSIPDTHTKSMDCKSGKISKTTTSKKINVTLSKVQNVTPCENQEMNASSVQTYGSQDNVLQKPNIAKKATKTGTTKKPNITLTKVPNATCQSPQTSSNLGTTIRPQENMFQPQVEPQDWESVMDALLSHKTPSLGPNALDVALKKDSFAKTALRNQRIVRKKELMVDENQPHKQGQSTQQDAVTSTHTNVTPAHLNVNPEQSAVTDLSTKKPMKKEDTQTVRVEPSKRISSVQKPQPCEALKEKDPFISGIPNSDYDLLDELMDDELRKEIGELSSDEDNYRAPEVGSTKVIKTVPLGKCTNVIKNLPPQAVQSVGSRCSSSSSVQNIRESIIQTNKRAVTKTYEAPKNQHAKKSTVQTMNIANTIPKEADKPKILENVTLPCSKIKAPVANIHSQAQSSDEQTCNVVNQNNNRSHAKLVDARNMLITSTPVEAQSSSIAQSIPIVQSRPVASKVVVIGSEVLYDPFAVAAIQTPIVSGLCNVNQTPYVALSTTPSITVYQTTQFAPPIINPVIIGNAMTVAAAERLPDTTSVPDTTSIPSLQQAQAISSQMDISKPPEIMQDCAKSSSEILRNGSNTDVTNNSNVEPKCTVAHDIVSLEVSKSEIDTNTNLDINFNKNGDRKVLSEVQDKQAVNLPEKVEPKAPKNQKHSSESEMKKEIVKDQEKPEIGIKSQQQSKILENITKQEDLGRIMMKRLAILDRTTLHRSSAPPIPLEYIPLITSKQKILTGQKTNSSITTPTSNTEICNQTTADKNITADNVLNNKVVHKQDNLSNENSKENDNNTTQCRRILLRSSNDLKAMTVTSNQQDQRNPVGRRTKVRLKSETKKLDNEVKLKSTTDDKNADEKDSPKRTSKRILDKKRNSLKKVENDDDTVNQAPNQTNKKNEKVLKTTKQAADVVKDDKEQIAEVKNDNFVLSTNKTTDQKEIPLLKSKAKTNAASNPTQNTDNFGMIDIEDALLGSKIPKIAQCDAQPEEQSINETENSEESVRPRPARKKRKPRKFSEDENVNTSSNNLNETNDKIETDLEKAVNHTDCVPSSDTEPGKTGVTISIIRNKKGSGKPQFKIIDGKPKPNPETRQTRGKNVNRNMEPPATTKLKKINVADKVIGTTNNSDVGVMKSKTETGIKINDLKKSKPELTIRSARANSTNKNHFPVISVPIKNAEKLPESLKNSGISLQENPVCNLAANTVSANQSHNLPATSNVKSVSMINDTGIKYSQSTIQTKRSKSKESVNVTNQIDMNTKTMGDVESPQTDSIIKIPFKKPCATTSVVVPPTSTLKIVNVKKDVMPLTSTLNSESGSSKVNMDASTPKINTQSVASRDLVSAKTNTLLPQNNVLKSSSAITNNTPQHTAKETITKSENPVTARDSFAELKEKIIIEELPSPPDNPTKKCVRIKLPNGKTFKATIFGKMHVSFESIFSDPALKATLLTNLNDTKRYTVNVKQVSTAAKNDPHKIVDARIEEVNVQARDVQPIETVNLLSDDEEDNDNTKKTQSFKTEFGEYKIVAINEIDLQNHQKKLNQTCFVKLMKMMQSKSSSHSEVIPRLQHSNSDNKLGVDEVVNNGVLDKIRTVMDAVDKQIVEIDKLNDLPSSSSNNHVAKVAICPIVKDDDTKDDRESTINNQNETNVRSPIVVDDEKEDHPTTLNNQNDDSENCPLVKDGENNDDLTTPFNNQTDISVERHIVLDDKINVEHINVLNDQSDKSTNRPFTSDTDKDDLTTALDIPAEKDSSCTTVKDIDIKDGPGFIDASCPIETENEKNKGLKMILNHQIKKDVNCRVVSIKYDDSKENVTTPKEQTEPIVLDENGKNYITTALYNQADNNVSSSNVKDDNNKSDLITIMNNQPEVDASCPIVTEEDKNEDIITTSNNLIEKYTSCPDVNDDYNGKDNFTTTSTNQTDSVLLDDDAKDSTKALDKQTNKDLNDPIVKKEEYLTAVLNNQTDKDSSCPIVLDDDNNEDDTAKTLHEAFDDKSHLTASLRNQTEDPSCPIVLDDDNDEDDTAKTLNEVFDDKSHLTTSLRNQTYKDTSCRLDDDNKDSVTTPMPNPIPRVITEVIEIDDSSNDSVGLINSSIEDIEETLRKEIANILKKPLPETLKETVKKPEEDIDELKMLLLKDLGVVAPNVENKQGIEDSVVDPIVVIDNDDEETPPIKTKKCFVRLENCDELAEEFEKKRIMKQRCVVDLVRCDDIISALEIPRSNDSSDESDLLENCSDDFIDLDAVDPDTSFNSETKRSRSGSFSLLDECPLPFDHKLVTSFEYGRSSPVMEVFDTIADLQRQSKLIMGNSLSEKLDDTTEIYELARSSPVMEMFETIASYRRLPKIIPKKSTISEISCFCCEWFQTKRDLHMVNAKIARDIEDDSFIHEPVDTPSIDQLDIDVLVPTLKALTVKLFQSDEILSRLRPYTVFLKKEAVPSPHKLKRKLRNDQGKCVANKILKVLVNSHNGSNVPPLATDKITPNTETTPVDKNEPEKPLELECSKTIESNNTSNRQGYCSNDAEVCENNIKYQIKDSTSTEMEVITKNEKKNFESVSSKTGEHAGIVSLSTETVCLCLDKAESDIDIQNNIIESKEPIETNSKSVCEGTFMTETSNKDHQLQTNETGQMENVCSEISAAETGCDCVQNNLTANLPEFSATKCDERFDSETFSENQILDSEDTNQTLINLEKTSELSGNVSQAIPDSSALVSDSKCKELRDTITGKENLQFELCVTGQTQNFAQDAPGILEMEREEIDSKICNENNQKDFNKIDQIAECEKDMDLEIVECQHLDFKETQLTPKHDKEMPYDPEKIREEMVSVSEEESHQIHSKENVQIQNHLEKTLRIPEAECIEKVNHDSKETDQGIKHDSTEIVESMCEEMVDSEAEKGNKRIDINDTHQTREQIFAVSESTCVTTEDEIYKESKVQTDNDDIQTESHENSQDLYDEHATHLPISDIQSPTDNLLESNAVMQNISDTNKEQSDKMPTVLETVETVSSCQSIEIETLEEINYETSINNNDLADVVETSQEIAKEVIIRKEDNSTTNNSVLIKSEKEKDCSNLEIKTDFEIRSMEEKNKEFETDKEIREIRSTEDTVNSHKLNSSDDYGSARNNENQEEISIDDVIIVSDQSNELPGENTVQSCLSFEYQIEVEHQSEDSNSSVQKVAVDESDTNSPDKNDLVIFDHTNVEKEIEIVSDSDTNKNTNKHSSCDKQDSTTLEEIILEQTETTNEDEESQDSSADIKDGIEKECVCYKTQSVQMLDHGYAFRDCFSEKECKIITETDVSVSCEPSPIHKNTLDDKDNDMVLNGIEYEDPVIGTCYVFPIAESPAECETDSDIFNDSTEEIIQVIQEISEDGTVDNVILETKEVPIEEPYLKLKIPKQTYSKNNKYYSKDFKVCKRSLKRKIDMTDIRVTGKKYRKGKNIDYPKITAAAILDSAYSREYKRVFDYCSSIKFSYSQPFHKEFIDVEEIIKDWPIQGEYSPGFPDQIETNDLLFSDLDIQQYDISFDPMDKSLAEELTAEYSESDLPCSSVTETNFKMGFGEGSDRVLQNLEDVDDDSKFSAATLSDVKQPQPFLLSEDYENNQEETSEKTREDQIKQLRRYITYIQMRDKVRSFFRKTTVELKYDLMKKQEKEQSTALSDGKELTGFPFDLYNATDFLELPPADVFVQVVQVGQLPVSAAAQNPVTCDPRVTQVSDASPSQCSVDNSPQDDSQPSIKTEYTELTTADLTNLPLVQEYAQHNQTLPMESQEQNTIPMSDENIPIETEIKSVVKIELMEETEVKEEQRENYDNNGSPSVENRYVNTVDYSFDTNAANATPAMESEQEFQAIYNSSEKQNVTETYATQQQQQQQPKQQNGTPEKTDQIAHAMNAAGITTISETMTNTTRAQALVNILSQKLRQGSVSTSQSSTNNYTKTTSINAMSLQQALAQILPPPLNQTNATENNQQNQNSSVTPQVLHIVQGKNASGSQITLVDNSQQSVINGPNATSVLHIVQNKSGTTGATSNGAATQQTNSFGGLSLVDAGIQQGGNQLLHIVNTGNQKNNNATGQLLKRVNLLTNLANVQGSNEQKMVQFVCKSADGKAIQLNAPHQRSMVLRLQPIENPNVPTTPKSVENQTNQDLSPTSNSTTSLGGKDNAASQQEIKSRSVYEENYAKFIQNSSTKTTIPEKSTSLPKFNQAFGKPVFQDGSQKQNEMNSNNSHLSVNTNSEGSECQSSDNAINLDHIGQISSPPLLLRKSPAQTSQSQANLVQQIKQTITPMNIQTMHGGVIYTRQIPVNIGGGQTINLITVPSTELVDESGQKQQPVGTQNEIEPSIIKIVPQNQTASNSEISSEDGNAQMNVQNETNQNQQPQPQPVLTQMRIKLPMLSKTPQMVSGARVVRPSFFQIQRNVIGGNNQPVYQQLVLTAAPPLGQQTIRLPQTQTSRQIKVPTENQSSAESQMSSSTLEQLREFDMVLEQVKERSSVPPNSNSSTTFPKLHTSSTDTTDGSSASSTSTETTQQVLYSIGNNHQPLNVAYVNRKATVTTPTTSTFVRSPDSSGIADSPTSSSHVQIPHTVTTDSSQSEPSTQAKPKVSSKSKSRPKASSNPPNNLKINTVPPKTSAQKPLEDEQTTQRILYILAEYKEQVENSPDKDKPAPRRRSNPPSNPSGSSKRKKSSSGSRRHGRDLSPIHGEDTCRTMGSEDSSCGTSQGDCNESCLESHSPQDSPRKVVRKLTFENETPPPQPRPQPQRNVIVADGQTITVARGTAGKPATAVLMPANYILPVSMVKGGQQIAIVTNRGPKLLTVGGGEGGATNALLLQRLIGPAGLKPVLARPGVRHVRLPTAALHNLQAFNLATATTVQPPDSTASPAPAPTPPELVDTRATSSPWTDRDCQDVKPERGSSPEGSEPWNLPSSGDPHDYTYEETVRADNLDRTVLVVQKKDGHRQHRLTHVSAAALRHKYAILEHELRLQKSLSEECEDLGVDSPSASELFPEAELLFAASPAHDHTQDQGHHSHTPQPTLLNQSGIPQPDIDDQIATDQLLTRGEMHDEQQDLQLGLEDVGMVGVGVGAGLPAALDAEEFARAHPNTTFHSEPTDDGEVQPFTIAGLKGRHITSTIFHSNRAPATVLMTAPQTTVISQATADGGSHNTVKYDIDNMINSLPSTNGNNINLSSVLVKDEGLTRFDSILNDSRELHLSNTASAIVHSAGNATQVIRRVCYDDDKRDNRFLMDEPDALIAGDDAKMIAEDSSRDATLESMAGDVDDDRSSPERHAELFWESNSASERSESRRPLDFSSDSEKCCKSPSYDETNSTDSSGVGTHMRLDSVIKDARGIERSGSADGSSADDTHPPLRTYPPKRTYHPLDGEVERSLSGKTRAGERSPDSLEVRRRASGRGVVKRGCHCCNGSPAPPRPKKSRQRKPTMDFTN
ncbi:hypothetical protein ABMA27_010722 [Loxostege sticticalis]|uniref:Uncharacterized protein n=1 Tax=Loxostege sticticalis TaxID=481309 RepID=A0ABR3H4H1_LOXSC